MKLTVSQRNSLAEVLTVTTVAALALSNPLKAFTETARYFAQMHPIAVNLPSVGVHSRTLLEVSDKHPSILPHQKTASAYRQEADRLLQQHQVSEARQIIELLEVTELENYLSNGRGHQSTDSGVNEISPAEPVRVENNASQGREIQIGKELTALLKIPESQRTVEEQQQIAQLVKWQSQIVQRFNEFIHTDTVKSVRKQLTETTQEQNLPLTHLNTVRDNLQSDAVLLYPLILPNRLELVLVTPDSPPIHRTVAVNSEELQHAIVEFRRALSSPNTDAKLPAQQLYNWLIKPIESDLRMAQAKTILYAPDAQLRYIPLAALHDGNQWLVERFSINNITAATLNELDTQPPTQLRVLAGGLTQGRYHFSVGSRQFELTGLPFAGVEVENLAATVPNTTTLLDDEFTPETFVPKMQDYNVVHLATHAAFVPGKPDDSFIVFGNGDRVTLREVQTWNLPHVDLVVLSACETGVGGEFGTGEEILGFGYLMQQAGAKAVMASLWSVDDGGTQMLMNAFYRRLQEENLTKAEALRQAQLTLIADKGGALGKQRGTIAVMGKHQKLSPENEVVNRFNHPYYWASFILIGNGL
ncbi:MULTISPECIES: CHAT domain-containing protein [unclassified Coleofasciculus]|uniref:CHAT domain-containing protein n=1 Tax=unclassified Coleofasciculus TaxID=2692782 RepID=UPI00187F8594|nr:MULTISPECIES: CHAT domain-containing protein [unclassified Coleofasciculus]MBE9125196.1 CHAT domain-containing protein [Coleofasciculus sp. LEGE 07081]MBE9148773.1 CHAT domain-containing protein [Coleofasciculus sp. LEGE 07092]